LYNTRWLDKKMSSPLERFLFPLRGACAASRAVRTAYELHELPGFWLRPWPRWVLGVDYLRALGVNRLTCSARLGRARRFDDNRPS
jgi:hypothetical protein